MDADVDADLIFKFTKSGVGSTKVPLQYSLTSDFSTKYYKLKDLEDALVQVDTGNISGTATEGEYIITDTHTSGPVVINKTVYWRWPYNVADHNTAALTAAAFTGTGVGGAWTDADDVTAGNSSQLAAQTATRDNYVLNLQIKATQKAPTVGAGIPITNIGAITGTAKVGNTLNAGVLEPVGADATYQWQISNGAGYDNIAGATGHTYKPVALDAGKTIKVVVTGTNGYTSSFTSAATAAVAP